MPSLPKTLYPVRKASAALINSPRHRGNLYHVDDVANQLSIAADVSGDAKITIEVDGHLLVRAFANDVDEYTLSYADYFRYEGDEHILYVQRTREITSIGGGDWTTAIGCFRSVEEAKSKAKVAAHEEVGLDRLNVGLDIDETNELVASLVKQSDPNRGKRKSKSSTSNNKKQRADTPEDKLQAEIDDALAEVEKANAALAAAKAVVLEKKEELATLNVSDADADAAKAIALQSRLDAEQTFSDQLKDELKSSLSASAKIQAELIKLKKQEEQTTTPADRLERDEGDEIGEESTDKFDMTEEFVDGSSVVLHVLLNGRACKPMTIDSESIICLKDLVPNLQPMVCDNAETRKKRRGLCKKFNVAQFGVLHCFVPSRASIHATSNVTKWRSDASVKKNLDRLVKASRCPLGPDPMRILTAFAQHNHGGSDEGTQMVIAGAWAALFRRIEYDITPEALGKIVPSQSMLASWDKLFGVDCFMVECNQINKSGVTHVTVASDHGERKKIVSLVKIVCYAGRDKDGNRIVKTFCLDFDSCGHSTDEAVDGLITSLKRLQMLCPGVKIVAISGDAGGGGAVQYLYERLLELGIMTEELSRYVNCILHALNKCIERPSIGTFVDSGIKVNGVNQLGYCAMKMLKRMKDEGGIELSDEVNSSVLRNLIENEEWQEEAAKNSLQALDALLSKVEDNEIESLQLYDSVRNLQLPVWTRWMTSIKAARIMKERWHIIYFHCVAIIQSKKSTAYLRKLAQKMLLG